MEALVIDDSRTMRKILGKILSRVGFSVVHEAGDGVEALETLRRIGPVALALVDWNMPHMNGYDFVRLVRSRRDFDALRLMMVTTETEAERVYAALEAGADEYVMKPFTEEVILGKLEILGLVAT
ncbi:MAG: response regulator [Sandaracinus sp.]|nr:response regulator [Sandaracinus sp.]MCB9623979.1 response regulator [Sandaracinus sp.]MCB9632501.1 response regulator [Sandaracinus sp.]